MEINFLLFTFMLLVSESVFSAQALEEYKYDALGRLTLVKENQTVKAGYCYDKAGNRKVVTLGGCGDNCAEPLPARISKPVNLQVNTHAGAGYIVSWSSVSGVDYYELQIGPQSNVMITLGASTTQYTTQSNTLGDAPNWVRGEKGTDLFNFVNV